MQLDFFCDKGACANVEVIARCAGVNTAMIGVSM